VWLVRIQTIFASALRRGKVDRENELDDLIAAFRGQLHQDHANPGRVGCPGKARLKAFAADASSSEVTSILDHIRSARRVSMISEVCAQRGKESTEDEFSRTTPVGKPPVRVRRSCLTRHPRGEIVVWDRVRLFLGV